MEDTNQFTINLEKFISGCNSIYRQHTADDSDRNYFTTEQGSRYMRVIRGDSVHCFIDTKNGDVLLAASAKAPAKNPRGNIFDDDHGLSNMGPYGPNYLKRGRKPKAVETTAA